MTRNSWHDLLCISSWNEKIHKTIYLRQQQRKEMDKRRFSGRDKSTKDGQAFSHYGFISGLRSDESEEEKGNCLSFLLLLHFHLILVHWWSPSGETSGHLSSSYINLLLEICVCPFPFSVGYFQGKQRNYYTCIYRRECVFFFCETGKNAALLFWLVD